MTANLQIPVIAGLLNHAKTATVTPTSEASGHDGDNLRIPSYADTWRSTSAGASVNIDLDLGSSKSDIEAIIVHGLNLRDAATFRILVDNNAGFPSPEHDSQTLSVFDAATYPPAAGIDDTPPWGRSLVYFPSSALSGRYIRITLTDVGNPDGYLEAAYAVVGPVLQPGPAAVWTPSPTRVGDPGLAVSRHDYLLEFRSVSEAMWRRVLSVERALRGAGRFSFVPHPLRPSTWPHEVILAKMPHDAPVTFAALPDLRWDIKMRLEEVID